MSQHSPQSTLDDVGIGVYGQATATFDDRLDVTAGARVDHESKKASLNTFFAPAIAPGRLVTAEESFSNVSPQFSVAFRFRPGRDGVRRRSRAASRQAASTQRLPPGFEVVRRRADVEPRGRREDDVGGWACDGERRRVPHRLGRSAAQPAGSVRACAVLHCQRRARARARVSSSS